MTRISRILYTTTMSTSGSVAAGDVYSDTESIGSAEGGWLDSIQAYNLADLTRGVTLYLYGANVAVGAESAAFTPSDTATDDLITVVTFSSGGWVDLTNNRFQVKSAAKGDAGMGVWCQGSSPGTDAVLYAAIVANTSTSTQFTTGSFKLRFTFNHG